MRDRHHILNPAREWRLRPEALRIREHPSLVPKIEREVHEALHAGCPPVPLLGYHTLVRVVKNWYPQRNTLQSMDELMLAIEESTHHPSTHQIERDLAQLSIQAIDLQRPFVAEGLVVPLRTAVDLGRAA